MKYLNFNMNSCHVSAIELSQSKIFFEILFDFVYLGVKDTEYMEKQYIELLTATMWTDHRTLPQTPGPEVLNTRKFIKKHSIFS